MNRKHRSLLQFSCFLFFNLSYLVQTLNGPSLQSPFTFADRFQYSSPGGTSRVSSKIRRYLNRNFLSLEKQLDASLSSKDEVRGGRLDVKRRNHLSPIRVTALDNENNYYESYLTSSSSSPPSFKNSLARVLNLAKSDRPGSHSSNSDQLRSFLRRLSVLHSIESLLKNDYYSGNPDSSGGNGPFSGDGRTSKRTNTRPNGDGAHPVFLGFGQETSNAALDAIARLMASEQARSSHGAHHDRAKESIKFIG